MTYLYPYAPPRVSGRALERFCAVQTNRGMPPSVELVAAIKALFEAMDRVVAGQSGPKVILSALFPGAGKTTALQIYLAELAITSKTTGILVCLERIAQVEAFYRDLVDLGVPEEVIAVWTQDYRDQGIESRPILITTQERIRRETQGRSFTEAERLHYNGAPRQLRLWDEVFRLETYLTLTAADVHGVISLLLDQGEIDATEALRPLLEQLDKGSPERITVPPFTNTLSRIKAPEVFANGLGTDGSRLRKLIELEGKSGVIVCEGSKTTAVFRVPSIPSDFLPVVVTDGSGALLHHYAGIEKRYLLDRLLTHQRTFSNLTIHMSDGQGSKTAWRQQDKSETMIDAIVDVIQSRSHTHKSAFDWWRTMIPSGI